MDYVLKYPRFEYVQYDKTVDDPIFSFERMEIDFDFDTIPTSDEKEAETLRDDCQPDDFWFSFKFVRKYGSRKLKISTSSGTGCDLRMPLPSIESVLNFKSVQSVKLIEHPTPYGFLKTALLNNTGIQSIRFEIENLHYSEFNREVDDEYNSENDSEDDSDDDNNEEEEKLPKNIVEMALELIGKNTKLKRLVIKDLDTKFYSQLFQKLIDNRNQTSVKALGLTTGKPSRGRINLTPLLQLPKIEILYCFCDHLLAYLSHFN
eukprot:gene6665-8245_t